MAHNNFWQLEQLILVLDDPRNDIFLHVDVRQAANFDQQRFKTLCKHAQIHIFCEIATRWGRYEQIQTEMLLFRNASKHGAYSFYHLISGSDLPIKTQDEIHAFFDAHQGENFIDCRPAEDFNAEVARRTKYYHFFVGKGTLYTFLHRALLVPQLILGIDRLRGQNIKIFYGANWCSLSHELVLYVLNHQELVKKVFSHTSCCDELFIQTLAKRGGFQIHNEAGNLVDSISRYIDWSANKPSPKTLDISDFDKLKASSACFARKIDSNHDQELVLRVLEMVESKQ